MLPSAQLGIYIPHSFLYDEQWRKAYELYEKYSTVFFHDTLVLRIPKIIHQIYVGKPLPEKYKLFQQTWQQNHPQWRYYLWTDKEIDDFGLYNKDLYDATSNLAQKADIARYEILYRMGGLYVDIDFECLKPFDILHSTLDFYAGIEFNKKFRINNALIGARSGHPILQACIERMRHAVPVLEQGLSKREQEIELVVQRTGPGHLTNMALNHCHVDRVVFFPNIFFYPFNVGAIITSYPQTFARHHWHMSWLMQ